MHSDAWSLEEAWEQRWCPAVNGLLFPDGTAVPVAPPAGAGPAAAGPRVRLTELGARAPLRWTTICPLTRAYSPDRALLAAAGEGGLGGDGFVALLAGPERRLAWIAFFDDSTAFEAVRFDEGCVAARTSAGREYRFPLAAPERISVA